jgi:uncharacterized protein
MTNKTETEEVISQRFQILALSGGGIRGLYTISVLATLEEVLAKQGNCKDYNIAQHFDLIAGTSIGGILALGLAYGINARKLRDIIDKNRMIIFPNKWLALIRQAVGSLYSNKPLQSILEKHFHDKQIKDLNTRVVIPVVNGTSGSPKIIKTPHHENFVIDKYRLIKDVGLATSAAPTFFPPYLMNDTLMVDGGLIANGPALVAYHEATHFLDIKPEAIHLLGVGTMGEKRVLNSDRRIPGWGYLTGWGMGRKLIEMTLSANEAMQNNMVQHFLGDRVIFLDESLTPDQSKSITLDNANGKAAQMLRGRGTEKGQEAIGRNDVRKFFNFQAPQQIYK